MSNTDGGTLQLRSFAQLSVRNQRAVVLKSQGIRHADIALRIEDEFGTSCSPNTINQWFATGGLLEQALTDYNEQLAAYSLSEAKNLLKRATMPAVITIIRLLNHPDPRIQLKSAQIILNKYIPDRQISETLQEKEEELPDELIIVANSLQR